MSLVQEEIYTQNDSQLIPLLNKNKIKGILELLIEPTLFFIKNFMEE